MDISPENIYKEVKEIACDLFRSDALPLADRYFETVIRLFRGGYDGFQACDTPYHDLDHTLEVTRTFARIVSGWNRETSPAVTIDLFDLGLMAALLHDAGYIKREGDNHGTGAKYTFTHVGKSAAFADRMMEGAGMEEGRRKALCNMIWHTCTQTNKAEIDYSGDEEKRVAHSVGTADIVGQMSSPAYLQKLPRLYDEFAEAYEHEGLEKLARNNNIIFENAEQLIKGTPAFYENWVKRELSSMGDMYLYIAYHYPDRVNHELKRLEENMKKITGGIESAG